MKRILSAAAVLSMFAALGCSASMGLPQDASHTKADAAPIAAKSAAKDAAPASDAKTDAEATSTSDAKSDAAPSADAKSDTDSKSADAKSDAAPAADAKIEAAPKLAPVPWSTGDYVVYRFSGSFHKTPATLTEKVTSRKGDSFTLEVTYDDGKTKEAIRARMKGDSPSHADVVSVVRLSNGKEQAASVALYDELFARVALVADQNEATLGTETVKLDIAGHKIACERATYRVKVGKQTATMKTTASASFVWGDVGAEITAANGKLLYKAEVVEAGHASMKQPAVASSEDVY